METTAHALNLAEVDPERWPQAIDAFNKGDAIGFAHIVGNHQSLALVADNILALKNRGIYERALLSSFVGTRTNHSNWTLPAIADLFVRADRGKLLAAGEPLPPGDRFTLYRGVSGIGPMRRVGGYSWTRDLPLACWFANRLGFDGRAVYRATVARGDVLAYYHGRGEAEFVCRPARPGKMALNVAEIERMAGDVIARTAANNASSISALNAAPLAPTK